jgi:hypothetical protein
MKKAVCILIAVFLTGCATTKPSTYDLEPQKTFSASYNEVWQIMNRFFEDREISLHTAEREAGIIVTEELTIPYRGFLYYSEYCDCGKLSGLSVFREIVGKFTVVAKKYDDTTTFVRLNTSYRASQWTRDMFEGWVLCTTKGHMEKAFFDGIESALKAREKARKLSQ